MNINIDGNKKFILDGKEYDLENLSEKANYIFELLAETKQELAQARRKYDKVNVCLETLTNMFSDQIKKDIEELES